LQRPIGADSLAVLSLLAAPLALAQQTALAPAKDATAITRQDNLAVYQQLPFADKTDFDDARRGFMGTIASGTFPTDDGRKYGIELRNSVLVYTDGVTLANPDATLTMNKGDFARLLMGGQQAQSGTGKLSGESQKVAELFSLLEPFDPMFNIVTP
jgi:alkyl sulfatase BDS1-like metallo-beta-lactamase superfamily hydrolase